MTSQKDFIEEHRRRLKNIESGNFSIQEIDRSTQNIPTGEFTVETDITVDGEKISSNKKITIEGREKILELLTGSSGQVDTVKLGSGEVTNRREATDIDKEEETKSVSFSKSGDKLTVDISTDLNTDELSELAIFFSDNKILQYDKLNING